MAFNQQESGELKRMLHSLNFSNSCLLNYISFSDLASQVGKSPVDIVLFSISGKSNVAWIFSELQIALGKRLPTIFVAVADEYETTLIKELLVRGVHAYLIRGHFDAEALGRTITRALKRVQVKFKS